LPGWLSFADQNDGAAVLSGIPKNSDVGQFDLVIYLTDGEITTPVEQQFAIDVSEVNELPGFVSQPPVHVKEDHDYSYKIKGTDPDDDSVKIQAEEIPQWLEFNHQENGTALLHGTPKNSNVGTHWIVLSITDGISGHLVQQKYELRVENTNDAPEFISQGVKEIKVDSLYDYHIKAKDPDGDSLTFHYEKLPSWLNLQDETDSTARITGVPSESHIGDHTVVLTITDNHVQSPVSQRFTLSVLGNATGVFINPEDKQTRIYPNPSHGKVRVDNAPLGSKLLVVTIYGSVVKQKQIRSKGFYLDLSDRKPGIYFIKITGNQQKNSHKILLR
jgi:hypothetical protein